MSNFLSKVVTNIYNDLLSPASFPGKQEKPFIYIYKPFL